jgi:hypothetical protein
VKLSDGEKLIAIMLADIMEANGVDGEIDPDFVREAITSGHSWSLRWQYPGIFHGEEDTEEVVTETANILDMCRVLENSISNLSDEDRSTIPADDQKVFYGFDGNNEPHYGVARMFIEKMGRWEEFSSRGLNSHMPTLDRYRRMKEAFDRSPRAQGGGYGLTEVRAILDA